MKLSVSSPTHDDFVLVPVVPDEYTDEFLPGSEMSYAEGSFGKVVMQQIAAEPFTALYNFYDIAEKCVLQFRGDAPPLRILIALRGSAHFKIQGAGEIHLKQGQFNLLYSPCVHTTIVFDQASDVLMFNLYLPVKTLKELAPVFSLQGFIDETSGPKPALLFKKHGWINAEILREISYLLELPVGKAFRPYLFEIKVKQLLHLLLLQKYYAGSEPIEEGMLESIREARHIIESTIGEMLTIGKIANLAGISEDELKKYFKHVTGMGLAPFIIQARLNNARLLIQETDLPIKEIAFITGYDHEQNFIRAFKKCFDYTPFFVRQRRP